MDSTGNIYVADTINQRIQVWDKASDTWTPMGSPGTETGQFKEPYGIAVDDTGNIYVADTFNQRIQVWNKATNTWTTMGSHGDEPGQFDQTSGIAVDDTGNIYVTDTFNHRIQVWNKATNTWTTMGSHGDEPGQFDQTSGIAVDDTGNIYVTDTINHRIQVWNKATNTWTPIGSLGDEPGQFKEPYGIAVDGTGNIYVTDRVNHRIQVWNKATNTWTIMGSYGIDPGQFGMPHGIAVDDAGNIYVADTRIDRIQVWNVVDAVAGSDVFVDNTVPIVMCTPGGIPVNGWYTADIPVTLSAVDEGSGIGSILYSLDNVNWNSYTAPFTVSMEGMNTVYWNVTDNAGNSALGNIELPLDKVAPTTTASLTGTKVQDTYYSDVTVTLTATDTVSGVNYTEYRVNNGSWIRYTGPFTLNISSNVSYRSVDNAENMESVQTISFNRFISPERIIGGGTISMDTMYGRQPTPTATPVATPVTGGTIEVTVTPTPTVSSSPTPATSPSQSASPTAPEQDQSGFPVWILLLALSVIVVAAGTYFLFFRK
ncbi:hypothetical protein RRC373 [Methanocella arvoryzae MRE50]|uniref:Uncharacterized protein n=1 Tax=Methanocella arvoryzae (strain DSM 22066 / NBRC 105507 / MRE50) TaxID=351160 RepID=Q0W0K5_METAR|nr:hypothetical protein [Methanocella arvoryzae]CAJ38088.1 hypothetical protein RRC373 [Methanocella arvoryzae MRE50]